MPIIDLSHALRDGMPVYPGDEAPRIRHQATHAVDGHLASVLALSCHAGTHVDAPAHFLAGQPGLEAMAADRFQGTAVVVDAPATDPPGPLGRTALAARGPDGLVGLDFVLLRTGWERHWGTTRYYAEWPWLDPGLARDLAGAGLKGVGIDGPSVDPRDGTVAHEILAAAGLVNVENLANLAALPAGRPFSFWALPLRLTGCEGSPVRAVAVISEAPPGRENPRC
jgi:arylformamidase